MFYLLIFANFLCPIYGAPSGTDHFPLPVSVPLYLMRRTGDITCETPTQCPQSGQDYAPGPCGEVCRPSGEHQVDYRYVFHGDKFQIYGISSPTSSEYTIYLDGLFYTTVHPASPTEVKYSLHYTSPSFEYGNHSVHISGKGTNFGLYKFAYWPSYQAIRYNITELDRPGWTNERDLFGGVRAYPKSSSDYASITIGCSKVWIIGDLDQNHNDMGFTVDNQEVVVSTQYPSGKRNNFALLYESDSFDLGNHALKIRKMKNGASTGICISCIYVLPTLLPPKITPRAIPYSIPVDRMVREGEHSCTTPPNSDCQTGQTSESASSKPICGEVCSPSSADGLLSYSFTFHGEKFQVFGTETTTVGQIEIYLDNSLLATVYTFDNETTHYSLLYTSDSFDYGEHTVKITGKGSSFQFHKIAYWPSVKAIRVNVTDISPQWTREFNDFGGVREYTSDSSKIKSINITLSKLWLFGSRDNGHGNMTLSIGDESFEINTTKNPRVDFDLLFENNPMDLQQYNVRIARKTSAVLFDSLYYYPEEYPQQASYPISVPINVMSKTTNAQCTNTDCPQTTTVQSNLCGQNCSSQNGQPVSYSYTFRGDKFQVYGTSGPYNQEYTVYLDNFKLATVRPYSSSEKKYALQYTSNQFEYGEHTVRITGQAENFKFHKIAYWPSVQATRINMSEMTGSWTTESDKAGGIRCHPTSDVAKEITITTSKFWIIGSRFGLNAGRMKITIDDNEPILSETTYYSGSNPDRLDFQILYESDSLELKEHTIKIQRYLGKDITLNCIFCLPVEPPQPKETPVSKPIPISVDLMTIEPTNPQLANSTPTSCPTGQNPNTNNLLFPSCGLIRSPATDDVSVSFSYTFKGEMFQLYGSSSTTSAEYNITLDNVLIGTIYPFSVNTIHYDLQYQSNKLTYAEHTVKVTGKGTNFKFNKLTYWVSLKAYELNIANFTENGTSNWHLEHDQMGGIRGWVNGQKSPITAILGCSKIWLIGSKDPGHNDINLTLNDIEITVPSRGTSRDNFVVLYEGEVSAAQYAISISSKNSGGICVNGIYYLPEFITTPEEYFEETGRLINVKDETAKAVKLELKKDIFQNIRYINDGGAIHLENCGITANQTKIANCSSLGNGGGIYICNTNDEPNDVNLTGLTFTNCEATNGAAMYIYTTSIKNQVEIKRCSFEGNEASLAGSAIYLATKNGSVSQCKFINNKGTAPLIKIAQVTETSAKILDMSHYQPFTISDCQFASHAGSSISITTSEFEPPIELRDCSFEGKLENNVHYIDASESQPQKLHITGCSFADEMKTIIYKKNINNQFSSSWQLISGIVIGAILVVIVVLLIILKTTRHNEVEAEA